MWEYNATSRDDYLAHASGHKYIRKDWKHGRWVYTYSDKFQQWPKVAERVRTAYKLRKEREARKQKEDLERRTQNAYFSRARADYRKVLERDKEDARYVKNVSSSRFGESRATKALKNSKTAKKWHDEGPGGYRGLDVRSLRRYNDIVDAANASIKSKKSLKRKAKKAYYKTRDAVKSIPSPINTHKVYKAGNRTTVVDERGPLISTKSNRKTRKKKRG